jgi:prolyl-tRNA synthetase
MLVRRDTREKLPTPMDGLAERVVELLDGIQSDLFDRAVAFREEHTHHTSSREEFDALLEGRPGFVVAPWCGRAECESKVKDATQATVRNIAFDAPPASGPCIECGEAGQVDVYFAKAY